MIHTNPFLRLSLRIRIFTLIGFLLAISIAGASIMFWYTTRMDGILTQIIEDDIAGFQTAEALETALVNQKGFVSYYFMDKDEKWLEELQLYRTAFEKQLHKALQKVEHPEYREHLDSIRMMYTKYTNIKDRVILAYQQAHPEDGSILHEQARVLFFKLLQECESYKQYYSEEIRTAREKSKKEAFHLQMIAGFSMFIQVILAIFLINVFISQILKPVQILTEEAGGEARGKTREYNEIKALSQSVEGLILDAGKTRKALVKSRENLMQSEKMALVGKLAASTAHSIRNPLTSVKMRLFSLAKSMDTSSDLKEDFDVISQEIRHIDTIIQNFLEFARPPKLRIEIVSPSGIVDIALLLLKHRLQSYRVKAVVIRKNPLPEIRGDPEKLKEVIVNIVVNACEAIGKEGNIQIEEETLIEGGILQAAVIHITDSGPGVHEGIQEKVFDPFFTTKEEGTGLGLSIAARIIHEHGGILAVSSQKGMGATFTISLPVYQGGQRSYQYGNSDYR